MPNSEFSNVLVKGIVSCVPQTRIDNAALYETFGESEIKKMSKLTGIESRPVVDDQTCTSDLCFQAAEELITELDVDRSEIDGLVFISQTPDYILPPTSCVLQQRLGLSKDLAAFDVNLGCSGYTYGLWLASSLHQGNLSKVLLLVGDTCSKFTSDQDRSTFPLFGDAGTATLIERGNSNPSYYVLGSNGEGSKDLIIKAGGFRDPRRGNALPRVKGEDGNSRRDDELYMNGSEVFTFTIETVHPLVESLLSFSGSSKDEVDSFVFHQANAFMLKHLGNKAKISPDKLPLTMNNFGNTSSASIPLTICQKLPQAAKESLKLALFGFGVGLSWGAALIDSESIELVKTVELVNR